MTYETPAMRCHECGSSNRGHHWHRGPVCDDCGATWSLFAVDSPDLQGER